MPIVASLYWLAFGIIFGSAANALIYRLPKKISWIHGRSICPSCRHQLHFWDLIPLLSFIFLKGKCRYCKKPISWQYPIVELATGVAFLVIFNFKFETMPIGRKVFNQIQNPNLQIIQTFILCVMFWVLMIIAIMDWKTKLISESMVLVFAILSTALIFTNNFGQIFNFKFLIFNQIQNIQILNNLLGLVVGVAVIGGIWLATRGRAMGSGDIELEAVLGWALGWEKCLIGLWIAFVAGSIYGLFLIAFKKLKLKSEIAFGPFLALGAIMAYIWGDTILKMLNLKF